MNTRENKNANERNVDQGSESAQVVELSLGLDEVVPDLNQSRRHFDAEGLRDLMSNMESLGQIHPILVRRDEDAFVIVDGERRWRVLKKLNEKHPSDPRFIKIRVSIAKDGETSNEKHRKAIQLGANMGVPLLPTEKALAIKALRTEGRRRLTDEELQSIYGLSKGELRYLSAIGEAPEFIQAFGLPQVYEVKKEGDGDETESSVNERVMVEKPPLGIVLLGELLTHFNKLRKWDDFEFRAKNGAHKRVAEHSTRRLGELAQKEEWTKSVLRKRVRASFSAYAAPKPKTEKKKLLRDALAKWERQAERLQVEAVTKEEWNEVCQGLRRLMSTLQSRVDEGTRMIRQADPELDRSKKPKTKETDDPPASPAV